MEQQSPPSHTKLDSLTPRQIVKELDRYVIGQKDAKRMVAIALRSRWRRQQLSPELREEIVPKNIIMIGPTGVGKTEISRRVSKLADAPFIKIEASKFTEVGYVGRDVESLIRDLTDISVNQYPPGPNPSSMADAFEIVIRDGSAATSSRGADRKLSNPN